MENPITGNAGGGEYTVYTDCLTCGSRLVGKRPQARFCSNRCRYEFHNRRRPRIETPAPGRAEAGGSGQHFGDGNATDNLPPPELKRKDTKLARVLAALARGEKHHRFTAERELHDHCLHTTVSTIERYGVTVSRRTITLSGFGGHPTRVKEYWLDRENREKATALLGAAGEQKAK